MNKPRLSGAARRKLAREQATSEAAAKGADYIPPMPALGKLETVTDYRRELNVVYRRMRQGHMPPEVATKSAFILNLGAALAKAEQELTELGALREQVSRIQSGDTATLEYATPGDYAVVADDHEPLTKSGEAKC